MKAPETKLGNKEAQKAKANQYGSQGLHKRTTKSRRLVAGSGPETKPIVHRNKITGIKSQCHQLRKA